eukprot:750457-Hanusia_phi.AAC.2
MRHRLTNAKFAAARMAARYFCPSLDCRPDQQSSGRRTMNQMFETLMRQHASCLSTTEIP